MAGLFREFIKNNLQKIYPLRCKITIIVIPKHEIGAGKIQLWISIYIFMEISVYFMVL